MHICARKCRIFAAKFLNMVDFIGVYDCTVDSKGRVIIPAPLKRQLQPFSDKKIVVKRSVFSPCLELYVMEEWTKLSMMLKKLNPFNKKNNDFKRIFFAGVKEVNIDPTGRVLLSKDLLTFSSISKDVIMASAGSYIEIWDKEAYEKTISNPDFDYGALAEEVMKDIQMPEDEL
jgi:MraZ protein